MKVCIPTMGTGGLDEEVSQHFGRAKTFTIVDIETEEVRALPNTGTHAGGALTPAEILASEGVDVMVVGGLGPKAVSFFEQSGIDVFVGAGGRVRDAIDAYKAGTLTRATSENACKDHKH
jgi:predicted Fe-Mo cluster-binding NifX family protein